MSKQVSDFEVIFHGQEHSQYFQGCGTAFTEYEDCYTGIGDTPQDALEDALEQAAMSGYDVEGIEKEAHKELPTDLPSISGQEAEDDDEACYDEIHYFVSIRVK